MKNLPDKIYLQIGEDINIDSSIDFNCLSEVTWCKDKINDNDIVYIRADQQQLSEETRKDFEKDKIKFSIRTKEDVDSDRRKSNNYLL